MPAQTRQRDRSAAEPLARQGGNRVAGAPSAAGESEQHEREHGDRGGGREEQCAQARSRGGHSLANLSPRPTPVGIMQIGPLTSGPIRGGNEGGTMPSQLSVA